MTTQTFRAPSTQEALEQIQNELGPEAIVVSVRQVPAGPAWQVWKQPEVEVVALQAPLPTGGAKRETRRPPAEPANATPASNRSDIENLLNSLALQLNQQQITKSNQAARQSQPEKSSAAPLETQTKASAGAAALARALIAARDSGQDDAARRVIDQLQAAQTGKQHAETAAVRPPVFPHVRRGEACVAPTNDARAAHFDDAHAAHTNDAHAALPCPPSAEAALPPALSQARRGLHEQGLDSSLLDKTLASCKALNPATLNDAGRVRLHFQRQLAAYIRTAQNELTAKVLFLIGSSGSGKTTACAKLAAYHASQGKEVVWVSADTVRAGAIGLARAYTDALGIPLRLAYTPEELAAIVNAENGADLILVDTPACNPRSQESLVELGGLLNAVPRRAAWLVAPANTSEASLLQTHTAFSLFGVQGLVFTRIDEAASYGSVFNLAWRSQLPIAYISNGSRAAADFFPAQAEYVTGLLFTNAAPLPASNGEREPRIHRKARL